MCCIGHQDKSLEQRPANCIHLLIPKLTTVKDESERAELNIKISVGLQIYIIYPVGFQIIQKK